jgi:hypothetical protein
LPNANLTRRGFFSSQPATIEKLVADRTRFVQREIFTLDSQLSRSLLKKFVFRVKKLELVRRYMSMDFSMKGDQSSWSGVKDLLYRSYPADARIPKKPAMGS